QGYNRPNDNQPRLSEQRQGYNRPNDNQPRLSEQRQGYNRPNDQQPRPFEQRQGYNRPNDNQSRPSEQRQGYNRPNDNQSRPSEQRQGYNRPNDQQPKPSEQRQGYNRTNVTYSSNRFPQQIITDFLPQEDGENLGSSTETLKPTSRKYHPESKNKSKEANKYGDKEKAKVHSVKRETKETITSFLKDVSVDTENTEDLLTAHKRKKRKKVKVNQANVSASIKETLAKMNELPKRKRYKKEDRFVEEADDEKLIRVSEFISVSELALMMEIDPTQIITNCFKLGLMVSINQRLDFDTINLIAGEFGFEVEKAEEYELGEEDEEEDKEEDLLPRPPIVTIMGHVDHGKTSLLDYIRNANVVAGEAGGITQHIGAYEVETSKGHKITFLDTPGHEAFTAMRSRGAQVTDIVILVVAADDSVMPQTIEAIQHAQAANVPIVIAINKIDKVGANPEKIKTQLSERGILIEEWGGKYQCIEISAKKGINVDKLLELVALEAEMINLRANPDRSAKGIVIEAKLDKGRGPVATVLITNGTLEIQDSFVCGPIAGRVRAMLDERGNIVGNAPPSTPVQILGFEGVPQAGDTFVIVESDKEAREIALKRQQLRRERQFHQNKNITLDQISEKIKTGGIRELRIIIKGDVDGSVEALSDSLIKLGNSEVAVKIILKGVGVITEADVLLASTSGAIILGFQIRPNVKARDLAIKEDVEIRLYKIIYDAINEIRDALEGLLAPTKKEEITALVEVRDTFKVPKIGVIAGCYVLSGKVVRNSKVRVLREDVEIFDGKINSLKRFKDDVKEVATGFECGIGVENFDNLKEKDIFEFYQIVEVKRKL
ncbi:translation initiation factor IF-2, partial [bacterium]|nr:translation initiation factor IF-2 [bacterium]